MAGNSQGSGQKEGKVRNFGRCPSRDVRNHDGFLFSLPFSRDARFSSWNSKIRRGGNERVIAYPRCNIVWWIASLTLFLPRSVGSIGIYYLKFTKIYLVALVTPCFFDEPIDVMRNTLNWDDIYRKSVSVTNMICGQ